LFYFQGPAEIIFLPLKIEVEHQITFSQALSKARSFCAYQERCHQEVREKLRQWGFSGEVVEDTLVALIKDNYLNEERFALLFAGGKFRIKKWGRIKIKLELEKRRISTYCINQALKAIEEIPYLQTLDKILRDRSLTAKDSSPLKHSYAIGQYAISKGFEPELVWKRAALLGQPFS
jgi:regulatory protein